MLLNFWYVLCAELNCKILHEQEVEVVLLELLDHEVQSTHPHTTYTLIHVCCQKLEAILTCVRTVHVTSYLNFPAEIRGLPSRNSVNVREIFRRASAPALQTGRGNVPTAERAVLGIRLSRVASETVFTLLVKAA